MTDGAALPVPAPGDPHRAGPVATSVTTAVPPRRATRTRLYRSGRLVAEGFPAEQIRQHLDEHADAVVWLDPRRPGRHRPRHRDRGVRPAPAGGRGRDRGPPAAQARPLPHAPVRQRLRGRGRARPRTARHGAERVRHAARAHHDPQVGVRHRPGGGPVGRARVPGQLPASASSCTAGSARSSTASTTWRRRSTTSPMIWKTRCSTPAGGRRSSPRVRAAPRAGPRAAADRAHRGAASGLYVLLRRQDWL
jgi:hypothetical protein